MDGDDVPVEMSRQDDGQLPRRQDRRRRTRPSPPGEHVYEISYRHRRRARGRAPTAPPTQFYWNLIPRGWRQRDRRRPTSPCTCRCRPRTSSARSATTTTGGCTRRGRGHRHAARHHRPTSRPNTPVTRQGRPRHGDAARGQRRCRGPPRCDRVLGTHRRRSSAGRCCSSVAGAASLGSSWPPGAARRDPQFPLIYAPPEGIGPAQAAYLVTEKVDDEQYVATLMYAAEKGAIDLDRADGAWTITDKQGAAGLGRARPGHHRRRAPPRRPGHVVHRAAEGRRGRQAAQGRDRARSSEQRRDLGETAGLHGRAAASAASAACWSLGGFALIARAARSGTRSR